LAEHRDLKISVYDVNNDEIYTIPLESLVAEVLASQIPVEFDIEALKAQAVIVRTNILRQSPLYDGSGCQLHPGATICNTDHCIKWLSVEELKDKWQDRFDENWNKMLKAVESTRGEFLSVNQNPIKAYFHLCCGGATENSENIIDNRVVYLRKVLCDYCKDSPYWEDERDITVDEMEERLGVKIKQPSPVKASPIEGLIDEIDRDQEGRIRSIRIGGKYFKGSDVKELLGLSSTRFGWNPVILRFYTRGRGHGLGMCQYGADAMAKEGSSYKEIIDYYFTGVKILSVKEFDQNKPLKGKVFVIDPGHGGDSKDNVGPKGLREKDVNLDIALQLSEFLQEAGAKAYLTRKDDREILLSSRAEMANSIRPHFFISIHQNGFYNQAVSGTEIYYYNGDKEGERLGRMIMLQLVEDVGAINKGVKTANFYILREAKVRSVLLELFYITNPEEEEKLKLKEYRTSVARSIFKGILRYYRE
jgi:stage II sporulation protein D